MRETTAVRAVPGAVRGFTRWAYLPLMAILAATATGRAATVERYKYTELHMGVQARITLYAAGREQAEAAARAAFERIAALEDVMSDYRPDSELMRLCARAGGPPVRVSADLLCVLQASGRLSRASGGAFDVTVGPVVALWRTARKTGVLPLDADLRAARRLVGWRKVEINRLASTVRLRDRGMRLDLGGIAKGYAVDQALLVLRRHGTPRALVEMGGDIAVGSPPPGAAGWTIEIADAGPHGSRRTIHLADRGISSSGDTEQYVEIAGKRYSHVVDPRTGIVLTSRVAVTVIAPTATLSDGLSTALSVLGRAKGLALARRYRGVRALVRHIQ